LDIQADLGGQLVARRRRQGGRGGRRGRGGGRRGLRSPSGVCPRRSAPCQQPYERDRSAQKSRYALGEPPGFVPAAGQVVLLGLGNGYCFVRCMHFQVRHRSDLIVVVMLYRAHKSLLCVVCVSG